VPLIEGGQKTKNPGARRHLSLVKSLPETEDFFSDGAELDAHPLTPASNGNGDRVGAPSRQYGAADPLVEAYVIAGDSFRLFLEQAGKHALLTRDEEVALAKRIEVGDKAAKDKLVTHNVRLVANISKKYSYNGLPREDLVQEGLIGTIRAAEKFDWRRGYKFSTYATWWIKQSMSRANTDKGHHGIRIPVHIANQISRLTRTEYNLTERFDREPTVDEIAEEMEIEASEVLRLRALMDAATTISLDSKINDEADSDEFGAFYGTVDITEQEAIDNLSNEHMLEQLDKAVTNKVITKIERAVMELRFGITGGDALTLESTGLELGITREKVRQLEHSATKKLAAEDILHLRPGSTSQAHQPAKVLGGRALLSAANMPTSLPKKPEAPQLPALQDQTGNQITLKEAQKIWDAQIPGETARFAGKAMLGDLPHEYWMMENGLPRFGEEMLGEDF